jgi:hypothetical protein
LAEYERGSDDRPRAADLGEESFDDRLAAEVWERGIRVGVRDTDMNDPPNAGPLGGAEQENLIQ